MEKNPNTNAETPANNSAIMFLNRICRMTETTDNNATAKKMIPNTIRYILLMSDKFRLPQ